MKMPSQLHPPFCLSDGQTSPVHDLPGVLPPHFDKKVVQQSSNLHWFVGLQKLILPSPRPNFCGSQFYGRRLWEIASRTTRQRRQWKIKLQLRNDMGYNVKINFSQSPLPSAISVRWPSKPKPVTSVMACTPVTAPISGLCCWVASSDVPLCPCALLWGCLFLLWWECQHPKVSWGTKITILGSIVGFKFNTSTSPLTASPK